MNKFKPGNNVRVKLIGWASHQISFRNGDIGTVIKKDHPYDRWLVSVIGKGAFYMEGRTLTLLPSRGTAEVYKSTHKSVPGFRYRLKGNNGETVHPSEHYTQKKNALQTLSRLFPEFEVIDLTKGKKK